MLCNVENEDDSQPFSRLFEQQDCHDLMFYLLEKITTITAKFSRQSDQQAGLTVGLDLQNEYLHQNRQLEPESGYASSDASTHDSQAPIFNTLSESQAELPSWKLFRSLKAYSLIGLNPLASMLCSTITCSKCGPEHQTYRW
jgi:ubiquitin C-terminal hydrolase